MSMHHKNMKKEGWNSQRRRAVRGWTNLLCDRGFGDKDLEEGKGSVTNLLTQPDMTKKGKRTCSQAGTH